jgi:hypothetical protein
MNYRRPGVYMEETLLAAASDTSSANSVACFVGLAPKGPANTPVFVANWGDFVANFGGFERIADPDNAGKYAKSYLPYSVYMYFQNGGNGAYIVRALPSVSQGTAATKVVAGVAFTDGTTPVASGFTLTAKSTGLWGNGIGYALRIGQTVGATPITDVVFTLQITQTQTDGSIDVLETFSSLSIAGTVAGTRPYAEVINDIRSGSRYVTVTPDATNGAKFKPAETTTPVLLTGGVNPDLPATGDLKAAAVAGVGVLEGPILLNIAGYINDDTKVETTGWASAYVGGTCAPVTDWPDRQDVFFVNDTCPPRESGTTPTSYIGASFTSNSTIKANTDSFTAAYAPWLLIPSPNQSSGIVAVPPGGAVIGIMSRIDTTVGVFRAPAGVIAGVSGAVGVQTKFTDTQQGDLNNEGVNIIRPVTGAGIAVMGARTRKSYGADRYVSGRRTLIYVAESLRRSTQFAVFENNDERLWSAMRMTAERILRPLWSAGGLRGGNAAEAYFVRCDSSVNTPSVIASGEVRMETGVALEYPAEFVVIRLTQFERGLVTTEVTSS